MSGRIVRYQNQEKAKLPEVGKIKVGKKVKGKSKKGDKEVEYPSALDHFRCTGKYADLFHKTYGEKPQQLGIVFISDNPEEVCNESYELRDGSGDLVAYGDGKEFMVFNAQKQEYEPFVIETKNDRDYLNKLTKQVNSEGWKETLHLKFILPKIPVFGHWKFTTHGKASTIKNIRDTFDSVLSRSKTVKGIPFDLAVEKVSSQKPGVKKTYPVVSLVPNISEERLEDIQRMVNSGADLNQIKEIVDEGHKAVESSDAKQIESKQTSAKGEQQNLDLGNEGTRN